MGAVEKGAGAQMRAMPVERMKENAHIHGVHGQCRGCVWCVSGASITRSEQPYGCWSLLLKRGARYQCER